MQPGRASASRTAHRARTIEPSDGMVAPGDRPGMKNAPGRRRTSPPR